MYLLTACTMSWLFLIGAFITSWVSLPVPRSTTDLVVISVVGSTAVLFSRLGLVSLLTLLIRLLPNGRMRAVATRTVLRIVPTVLRSSVLAAASASLAVHAAQAAPLPADDLAPGDHCASATAASALPAVAVSAGPADSVPEPSAATSSDSGPALDPGWPTAVPDDALLDPGWPSTPPADESESGQNQDPPPKDDDSTTHDRDDDPAAPDTGGDDSTVEDADETADDLDNIGEDDDSADQDADVHIVGIGESLWSIAADQHSSSAATGDIVDEIYTANREVIGANPNLIMPGQRLEIQP